MDLTPIPGAKVTINLATNPIVSLTTSNWNFQRDVITKKYLGSDWQNAHGGQRAVDFSYSGSLTVEEVEAIFAAYMTDAAIAATLQMGEASGPTDAGLFSGSVVISGFNPSVSGDGVAEYTLSGTFNGAVTHTPAGS